MVKTVLGKQKKIFFKYLILLFLLFSTILVLLTSFLQYNINSVKKNELLDSEQKLINAENDVVTNDIEKIISDLLYISDSFRLHDTVGLDNTLLEQEWLTFSNDKEIYDQIRFIDVDGNEVIRVNYTENGATLVDPSDLQNKKDRYYFKSTINLEENQICLSALDLNIENDQIEEPMKPILRISTPYYDENGQLLGIIILNYLAYDMLHQIEKLSTRSYGDIFMLNSDGYWLIDSNNPDNAWSFMYEDKTDISFRNEYPDAWEAIQSNENGYQITDDGVFIYSRIISDDIFTKDNYSFVLDSGDWILVSYLSEDSQGGALFSQNIIEMVLKVIKEFFYLYIFLLVISIIIANLVAINKNEREQTKYFSEYDAMTGVYNRRAGLEKLSQAYKNIEKHSCVVSICFIDINGLKDVNDALGHDAGDALILSVITGIKQSIRKSDFVARLGGDEFLIIFEGQDERQSEQIWDRIVNEYNRINETENRAYMISASHGIETFRCGSQLDIDTIVNDADNKMYNEKREIKRDLKVLK